MKKHLKENAITTIKAVMKKPIGWPRQHSGFSFILIAVAMACSPVAQARQPSEDRGNGNSAAENVDALNLTTTGSDNTAHGWFSLFSNTTGSSNTADGFKALHD
ncbi:MAG TPA: hypothetical protein VIS53_01030, partial [Candidatus Udaeobacter sp.]